MNNDTHAHMTGFGEVTPAVSQMVDSWLGRSLREENDGSVVKAQNSSLSFSLRGGDPNLQTTKSENGSRGGTHRVVRLGHQKAIEG